MPLFFLSLLLFLSSFSFSLFFFFSQHSPDPYRYLKSLSVLSPADLPKFMLYRFPSGLLCLCYMILGSILKTLLTTFFGVCVYTVNHLVHLSPRPPIYAYCSPSSHLSLMFTSYFKKSFLTSSSI